MKVTISYQVDFEDVPQSISDLLLLINNNDLEVISNKIMESADNIVEGRHSQGLENIDELRHYLSKLDQRLLDYVHILNGYTKADADLKSGMTEEQLFPSLPDKTQKGASEESLEEKKND